MVLDRSSHYLDRTRYRLFNWIKMVGNELAGSKTLFLVNDIIADEKLDKF